MENKSKVAVISDIHANADALTVAFNEIQNAGVDMSIVLGDVLTYGCQPVEVINILNRYKKESTVIFIKGNHDQFYFDLQSGADHASYNLPKFVKESVDWTIKEIDSLKLKEVFTWQDDYYIGDVYFSHANPFKYGDWSYIEDVKNLQKSFQTLSVKKVFSGVFGHSHRQLFVGNKDGKIHELNGYRQTDNIDQLIVNTGSIGQPRGRGLGYIILEIEGDRLTKASFKQIKINFNNSISLIKKVGFSCETEAKLIEYLQV